MFAMAGARWEHCRIRDNIVGELHSLLKESTCQQFSGDMRVCVSASGLYTYPDIIIVCGEPMFQDEVFDTLLNPLVIFEVLSESTEKYDRGAKFDHYRQLSSLLEYVLVSKDQMLVERYVRSHNDSWILTIFRDPGKPFEMASITASVTLAEIYRGVTLPESPPR